MRHEDPAHRSCGRRGIQQLPANTLGIRHIAFAVEDIEAVVARLKEKGTETFSEKQAFRAVQALLRPWSGGDHPRVGRAHQVSLLEGRTHMRKLWVKAWITLDGVFDADTMDHWWQNTNSPERMRYITEEYSKGDAYLMGPVTYEML